jgi:hypothetical protein
MTTKTDRCPLFPPEIFRMSCPSRRLDGGGVLDAISRGARNDAAASGDGT